MSYGSMDKSTAEILTAAGIDPEAILAPEDAGAAYEVAIMFDGALDESFLVSVDADVPAIVNAIADELIPGFPDNEVAVMSSHVYITEDTIEGSGFRDSYTVERMTEDGAR